jgi:hypothetical protein
MRVMNDYPMLHFIGRHGGWCAILAAVLPVAAAAWAVMIGASPWWLAAGIAAAVALFVLVRSYVELVRVMIDMLLPK